ncbi:uncharacterized protein LOC133730473 [Rosa rugosa]|uniref:uncharacterized protein LOC133730473 n=1 Tax=Rosa rugosa TaxID=74645 RepID=UPI002B403AC7|nr:uncharacterized protein LOC133730473 [Rosa rugosa]
MGYTHSYSVDPLNTTGGLSLWWKDDHKVNVKDFSKYFIDSEITLPESGSLIRVTWMYGTPYHGEKEDFWSSWFNKRKRDGCPCWPESCVTHLARIGSDHNLILFTSNPQLRRRRAQFKFEAQWAEEEESHSVIKDSWDCDANISSLSQWEKNLNKCRVNLQKWSRKRFPRCNKEEIKACLLQLENLQLEKPLSSDREQADIEAKLGTLWLKEEKYWHQRSRVNWLKTGDSNTREFGEGQASLQKLNQTHIVLIPKVPNPEKTTQFRPISLCNNSYKILAKVLANRLKTLLPSLISPNQNAFVLERLIQDNILLAHEAFHYLRLKRESGNHEFGLKLDMNKAYDRVDWDFLKAALTRFGFSRRWITLIMMCVTSVSFSVVLNGNPGYFFKPSCGLRQGDPLSPYLFLIVSEVLSLRITRAIHDGSLLGIKLTRSCPVLSHLTFAEYSLFFLKVTLLNCWQLGFIINEYCRASGQMVNSDKSSIFFSPNTPDQMRRLMCALLKFVEVDNPGNSLGMPTIWGRSKKEALLYIKERIGRKLEGWKEKNLSTEGKEVLIKSVALSIPAYPMACFKFPKGLCDEINSAVGNFWWGESDHGNKIHWKSWGSLCTPKEAVKGHRASWGWSSLIQARDALFGGTSWQVINGYRVNIWKDRWLHPPDIRPLHTVGVIPLNAPTLVQELIDRDTLTWNLGRILHLLQPHEVNKILSVPIGDMRGEDKIIWPWNKNGVYSVKSGYHWVHSQLITTATSPEASKSGTSHSIATKVWKLIWSINTLPKIKSFLWKVLSGATPTFLNLHKRRLSISPICPICDTYEESIEHTLLLCPWVQSVWFGSPLGIVIDKQQFKSIDIWLMNIMDTVTVTSEKNWLLTLISTISWAIWRARCDYIYSKKQLLSSHVINFGSRLAFEYWESTVPCPNVRAPKVKRCWIPPPPGYAAINCDATWKPPRAGGLGVVIRNETGLSICGASQSVTSGSVEIAEAQAVLLGVNLAVENHLKKVRIQSDSQVVISDLITTTAHGNWKIFPIIDEIHKRSKFFKDITWEWIPQEANMAAHTAASLAKSRVGLNRWVDRPPPSLSLVLRNDGLPCPPVPEE